MTRTKRADARSEDQGEQLADAVNKLADEVGVLRQALDEFREIFRWAVHNGKLANAEPPQEFTHPPEISVTPQLELDEEQFEAITETVQQSLSDVGEDLEGAVRDQLKHELSEFRESLDQFSIDLQWIVRQARNPGGHSSATTPELLAAVQDPPAQPASEKPNTPGHDAASAEAAETNPTSRQGALW